MNIKEIKKIGIKNFVLLLIAGLLLLICTVPGFSDGKVEKESNREKNPDVAIAETNTPTPIPSAEERLKTILSTIEGVGKTEVMIFYNCSEEQVPLLDEKGNPVQNDRNDFGMYIMKTKAPEMEGVLVVAEGAKNIGVIEYISNVAEALFGLPKHKIIVLPMKKENGSS